MRTPVQLEVSDEIDRLLIQAGAITGLLRVEPSDKCVLADDVVMNAAWLLGDMIERVHVLVQESQRLAGEAILDE
jgi:hypothetical protein